MILVIASLLILAQVSDSAAQRPVIQRNLAIAKLVIPDEIAPAVVPYMGCLFARQGVEVRGTLDPRPKNVAKGGDCSERRDLAARNADKMLRRLGGRSVEQRHEFIENTLVAMEEFSKASAPPIAPESVQNAPNN